MNGTVETKIEEKPEKDEVNYYDVFGIGTAEDKVSCVRRFVEGQYREVDLDAYQVATRIWVGDSYDFTQSALKLVGEMGEVIMAGSAPHLEKEVGDNLWYLARVADYLGVRLSRFLSPTPVTLLFDSPMLNTATFVAASQIAELAGKFRMHHRMMTLQDEDTIVFACNLIAHWLVSRMDITLGYGDKESHGVHRAAAQNLIKLWGRHGGSAPNYYILAGK